MPKGSRHELSMLLKKLTSCITVSMLALICFGFAAFAPVYAADDGTGNDNTVIINVPADMDLSSALNRGGSLEEGQTLEVIISPGTYSTDKKLHIWSNTTIEAAGATIQYTGDETGTMMFGVHRDPDGAECHGSGNPSCGIGGHNQVQNVIIDGGVWDRNSASDCNSGVLALIHGNNITIKNATFQNSTNHLANLSGSKDVSITNCIFRNNVRYTGTDAGFWGNTDPNSPVAVKKRLASLEAIHLDYVNKKGENGKYPLDNTPAENITISDCIFYNVGAGAGTHSTCSEARGTNIKIVNCSFGKIWGRLANFCSFDNCTLSNCYGYDSNGKKPEITDATALCGIEDCTGAVVSGVTLKSMDGDVTPPVYIVNKSSVKMSGIRIYGNTNRGSKSQSLIYIDGGSAVGASGIKLYSGNKGQHSISAVSSALTLKNSAIGNAQNNAILLKGGKLKLDTVVIKGSKVNGVYANKAKLLSIINSTITASHGNGIYAAASSGISLLTNKITASALNGISLTYCSGVNIKNNTVATSGKCGMYVNSSRKVAIGRNVLNSNKGIGIYAVGQSSSKYCTVGIGYNTIKAPRTKYAVYLEKYCKGCGVKSNKLGGRGYGANTKYKVSVKGNKRI